MKYLVVIDCSSVVGMIYANGNHDGRVTAGSIEHPALLCTEIMTDNPYYIFCVRQMAGGSHQSLYLPHGSVAVIYRLEESESLPIGFLHA